MPLHLILARSIRVYIFKFTAYRQTKQKYSTKFYFIVIKLVKIIQKLLFNQDYEFYPKTKVISLLSIPNFFLSQYEILNFNSL